jgi:hypothetical protein
MHFSTSIFVTCSIELANVLVSGQTNRVLHVNMIRAERDALFGEKALNDASIRTGPVANKSFDDPIHPFKRHHVVQEQRPEMDDIVHDMDQQMNTYVKE